MDNINTNNTSVESSAKTGDFNYIEQCAHALKLWHDKSAIAGMCNNNGEHYIVTDAYANMVGFDVAEQLTFSREIGVSRNYPDFMQSVRRDNAEVFKYGQPVTSLEIHEFANGLGIYRFRRYPVINPHTNNIVAVRFHAEPFCLHISRRMLSQIYQPKQESAKNFITGNLGKACKIGRIQLDVMFYSLLGFKSNKDISQALAFTEERKVEHCVRTAINSLNTKFGVSSMEMMLNVVRALGFDKYIPASAIKCGSYRMNEAFVIVESPLPGKSITLK